MRIVLVGGEKVSLNSVLNNVIVLFHLLNDFDHLYLFCVNPVFGEGLHLMVGFYTYVSRGSAE
jgi:hypothetical protein